VELVTLRISHTHMQFNLLKTITLLLFAFFSLIVNAQDSINETSNPYCDDPEIVEHSPEVYLVTDDETDTESTLTSTTNRCQMFEGKDRLNEGKVIRAYIYYGLRTDDE